MINEYEVPSYLVDELPEINDELKKISPKLNLVKSIQCLAFYTRNKVMQHDLRLVRKCFSIAENIYLKGNTVVRDAIENVYVYSFSSLLSGCNREQKTRVQSLMPLSLHTAYIQQLLNSRL